MSSNLYNATRNDYGTTTTGGVSRRNRLVKTDVTTGGLDPSLLNPDMAQVLPSTKYVSVNGSDVTGDGSAGRPYRTGVYALAAATGDAVTLNFGPGAFTDSLVISSATPSSLTIRGEGITNTTISSLTLAGSVARAVVLIDVTLTSLVVSNAQSNNISLTSSRLDSASGNGTNVVEKDGTSEVVAVTSAFSVEAGIAAAEITFDADVAGDWTSVPGNVAQALNALASRVAVLESAVSDLLTTVAALTTAQSNANDTITAHGVQLTEIADSLAEAESTLVTVGSDLATLTSFTPSEPGHWPNPDPATIPQALNSLAASVSLANTKIVSGPSTSDDYDTGFLVYVDAAVVIKEKAAQGVVVLVNRNPEPISLTADGVSLKGTNGSNAISGEGRVVLNWLGSNEVWVDGDITNV